MTVITVTSEDMWMDFISELDTAIGPGDRRVGPGRLSSLKRFEVEAGS
jgi:hypothetical protein